MAVERTGRVRSAKKLRLKQKTAPSFLGSEKSLLGWFSFGLELIGKPLFWLLVASFLFTYLIGRLALISIKQASKLFWILSRFNPRILAWLSKLLLRLIQKLSFSSIRFLRTGLQKVKALRWPRIKIKRIRLPKIPWPRPTKKWLLPIVPSFLLILAGLLIYGYIFKDLPNPNGLTTQEKILTTKIYDRHGELLYKIYRHQNRTLVQLEEIPTPLIQATIAVEDAEFYQHRGFSLKAIIRSFIRNLRGDKLYGGSTITQQLVKNRLLSPEQTLKRKIREVVLALAAEEIFSKEEILRMYFNEVGYGGAAYGVEEASQMYFGKSVRDLNLAEAALLAGLPASPTSYSPFGSHPEKAKERQTLVLRRMAEEGFITEDQAEKSQQEELRFAPQRTDIKAPHFVMYVREILEEKYGRNLIEKGGLEVRTSLDLGLQKMAQEIVSQKIESLAHLKVSNGAALITHPQNGEVLAMVGSRDYFDQENDGNVNVTLRPRQPGSSIKPVNYSLALENGFTPATVIPDTPITYHVPGQPPYSPQNYDNRFHGNVPLRIALASSYNVPAVKVLAALGVTKMIERGQVMGITTWEDPSRFGLSLTLGGGEVKMVDMAVAYGTLANLGTRVDLNPVLEVKDHQGKSLEKNESDSNSTPEKKRVLSPQIAYILTDILSDNAARTPAFGSHSILNVPDHPHVAVKTGTTQNLRDNWTIGYSPDYLVAVWVGNNDNTPMSYIASGVTGASPIWQKIMAELLKEIPDKEFTKPEDLNRIEICPSTGSLPCEGCGGQWEYFLPGTEPKNHCLSERIKAAKEKKAEKKEEETN